MNSGFGNSELPGDLSEKSHSGEGKPSWGRLRNQGSGDSVQQLSEAARRQKTSEPQGDTQAMFKKQVQKNQNINGSKELKTS
jgi:hypothetical protein